MTPLMPIFAMNSNARPVPPWMGCQHSTGSVLGPWHQGDVLQRVAAIRHPLRREVVVLALVGESLFVERFEYDFNLFLEKFPVGRLVHQRRAEYLHLPGVVAPSHAENHSPVGQPVRHGKVLRQPQRMPHRRDVETAPEPQPLGDVGQMHNEHQQIRDALVTLGLEVVLRHPEGVVPVLVQGLRDGHALVEGGGQVFVRVRAVIHRSARIADVLHVHVAGVQAVKSGNH